MTNNYDEMKKKYPKTLANVYCGYDHPSGWDGIVEHLLNSLHKLIEDGDIKVDQTKEKFGGLCFYYHVFNKDLTDERHERISNMITSAMRASYFICEQCGTSFNVTTNSDGWMVTQCDSCREKNRRRTTEAVND